MSARKFCRTISILLFLLLFFSTPVVGEVETSSLSGVELQNRFIDTLIQDQIPVLISFTNFGEAEGVILAHDASVILLQNTRQRFRQRLVFKNTVAVIAPIPVAVEVLSDL